eukprot:369243_1
MARKKKSTTLLNQLDYSIRSMGVFVILLLCMISLYNLLFRNLETNLEIKLATSYYSNSTSKSNKTKDLSTKRTIITLNITFNQNSSSQLIINEILPFPSLICIGAQKAGTGALLSLIKQIPELYHTTKPNELHWFDPYGWTHLYETRSHIPNALDFRSYNTALNFCEKYWTINGYKRKCVTGYNNNLNAIEHNLSWFSQYNKKIYVMEKTPEYMFFPHIANTIVNNLVKYGTKLLVMLRDPSKRFVSGLLQGRLPSKTKYSSELPIYPSKDINKICGFKSVREFNANLELLYQKWKYVETMNVFNITFYEEILHDIRSVYSKLIYENRAWIGARDNKIFMDETAERMISIWLRGCYAPQILHYTYYLQRLNIFDSFKIIQSERMWGEKYFQINMRYLRCYLHSTDMKAVKYGNYDMWMRICNGEQLDKGRKYQMDKLKTNPKTGSYVSSAKEIEILRVSYATCNKLLQSVLDSYYDNIILEGWNWTLWNI